MTNEAQLTDQTRRDIEEERLVAELELLGIRYLSRHMPDRAECVRSPEALLADLVRQPSARVRVSVVAVLLAHPEYAQAVPAALERLLPAEQWTLRFFYSAAVLLQQEYAERLRPFLAGRRLPDRFGADLDLPVTASPREQLIALGRRHRQRTRDRRQLGRNIRKRGASPITLLGIGGPMEPVTAANLKLFFQRLSERYSGPSKIYLHAPKADIIPQEFQTYFEELRRRITADSLG